MFWIIVLLLAGQDTAPAPPDGFTMEWVSKPKPGPLEACVSRHIPNGPSAKTVMECTSAANDRLENCKVIASTHPGNPDVDAAMLCSAEKFRIRTKNSQGEVITGVTVKVPYTIRVP